MAYKFEDILNSCLESMLHGASINDCLKAYPGQAAELEPLLKTCAALSHKSAGIKASPELRRIVFSHLQETLRAKPVIARERFFFWHRRWAVSLASIAIIFASATGIFAISEKAMPDEFFYPAKLASEQMELVLTLSTPDKAKLHIQFAQRRTEEMTAMALQDKSETVFLLSERASEHIMQMQEIFEKEILQVDKQLEVSSPNIFATTPESIESRAAGEEASTEILRTDYNENLHILQMVLEDAPEELVPYLERAIENLEADYERTISIIHE
jgi:hypothetical protein